MDRLLIEFQQRQALLAMLVDEYGMISGMITLENVIEAIVGTIQDEFDSEMPDIIRKGKDRFEVLGGSPVDLVTKGCLVEIPNDIRADTIGGVMIEILGHIPKEGERVQIGKHALTVLEASQTRIQKVLIEPDPESSEPESEKTDTRGSDIKSKSTEQKESKND